MPVIYGFSAYLGNPYMGPYVILGEILYGTTYGTVFFSNNDIIIIDMRFHKNVIKPIFTRSFLKLLLDST